MNNNTKPTNTKDAKPKFANLDMDKFKFDFDPAGADRLENLIAVAYEKLKTHDTFKDKTTDV